ncbi:hypothetical protein M501DRAFT_1000087 [Patellaria atrata CBS 101060]|uniref:Zn(2)-C6 fungal-type domain-containing protein n=1 Tax=Patellaria atrata CBS 101060 TaxID=1346257 RepID=A0A9P4S1W3_9PEZI|nr:hypothetical protein M501DRAFT_1000087 [Patellaria atrata CBS 101060]
MDEQPRRRKAHRKSRKGCNNCKLRRIKCDETKPGCKKCIAYGVSCNYDAPFSELDLCVQGSSSIDLKFLTQTQLRQDAIQTIVNEPCGSLNIPSSFMNLEGGEQGLELPFYEAELFHHFSTRSILTMGASSTKHIYQREIPRLASLHPFLKHIGLTHAILHRQYTSPNLSASSSFEYSTELAYHWYHGTALFNDTLSRYVVPHSICPLPQKLRSSTRDALWAAAILLGAIAFAAVDYDTVDDAWPLTGEVGDRVEWLNLSDGKKTVWAVADIHRLDSCFHEISGDWNITVIPALKAMRGNPTSCEPGNSNSVVYDFKIMYDLTASSTPDINPYHTAASIICHLWETNCTHAGLSLNLAFITHMDPAFKKLLELKDVKALNLLAEWYAKIEVNDLWWIKRRAQLEGAAIKKYLSNIGFKRAYESFGNPSPRNMVLHQPLAA